MKIILDLSVEETMSLILHLGWVGFEMPMLNKQQREVFRKAAKQIWNKVHSPEDQLKAIEAAGSTILKAIYDYTLPGKE